MDFTIMLVTHYTFFLHYSTLQYVNLSCINEPGKVRNDEFLKKIMNSVKDKLAGEEEELLEYEDPFSCVY